MTPNKPVQRTALCAAAEPERYIRPLVWKYSS